MNISGAGLECPAALKNNKSGNHLSAFGDMIGVHGARSGDSFRSYDELEGVL